MVSGRRGDSRGMDLSKPLATGLAVSRTLFGASYLLRPQQARSNWIGRAARKPGAQVMIRSQGVRDVALGAGALAAVARGDGTELRRWMIGHTVADLADLVVTWAARDDLPTRRARLAMGVAAVSTIVGGVAAATARPSVRTSAHAGA
jgi:hypothetical protein